jgi:hypothetical protein
MGFERVIIFDEERCNWGETDGRLLHMIIKFMTPYSVLCALGRNNVTTIHCSVSSLVASKIKWKRDSMFRG